MYIYIDLLNNQVSIINTNIGFINIITSITLNIGSTRIVNISNNIE
jgi:hypothetical protein